MPRLKNGENNGEKNGGALMPRPRDGPYEPAPTRIVAEQRATLPVLLRRECHAGIHSGSADHWAVGRRRDGHQDHNCHNAKDESISRSHIRHQSP